jgi:hypothetical protein
MNVLPAEEAVSLTMCRSKFPNLRPQGPTANVGP